jgi:hypothetical protein
MEVLVELKPPLPEPALVVANPKLSYMAKQRSESSQTAAQNGKPKIRENPIHQDQLSRLLQQTYALLKKFGEAADVAEMRDAGFQLVLGEYSIDDVIQAFMTYLKTNKEIPTPSDIVAIIDPSVKPLCPHVYQRLVILRREQGQFALTSREEEYIRRYEDQQLGKVSVL